MIFSFGCVVVNIYSQFSIHEQLHKSVGIDLTPLNKRLDWEGIRLDSCEGENIAASWKRSCFGLNQSSQHSVTFYYLAKGLTRPFQLTITFLPCHYGDVPFTNDIPNFSSFVPVMCYW